MKNYIINLACLLMLVTSCDRGFVISGQVQDESGKFVDSVKIVTSEKVVIYSDSVGFFEANLFGPGSHSDKLEALVSKEGYETIYIDLSQFKSTQNISLKIRTSNQSFVTHYPEYLVTLFYFVNLIFINLTTLFTLIFVIIKNDKYKWMWVFLIMLLNISLEINYINGSFDVGVFQFPLYLKHYLFYPFTIKVAFPIIVVTYWIIFLFKHKGNINKKIFMN